MFWEHKSIAMDADPSMKTLIVKSRDYLETKIELVKLKAIDKSSDVLSGLIFSIVKIVMILFLILFASIGLAVYLGALLGEYYYGFLIVAGIYALVMLIIYVQRKKWIKEPIENGLIDKILK
jgi:hypothetical protein